MIQTTFLKQSILLAFDQNSFELDHVNPEGIWVSRITSRRNYLRYRVSINTKFGKHFDLQVIINDDVKYSSVMETLYWLLAISNHPYEADALPRLGCCRPELRARSLIYLGHLTMWEKIREYSERRRNSSSVANQASWRKLYVRGLTAIFKGWKISGKRIIPGAINPENMVVHYQDYLGIIFVCLSYKSGHGTFAQPRSKQEWRHDGYGRIERARLYHIARFQQG